MVILGACGAHSEMLLKYIIHCVSRCHSLSVARVAHMVCNGIDGGGLALGLICK